MTDTHTHPKMERSEVQREAVLSEAETGRQRDTGIVRDREIESQRQPVAI